MENTLKFLREFKYETQSKLETDAALPHRYHERLDGLQETPDSDHESYHSNASVNFSWYQSLKLL